MLSSVLEGQHVKAGIWRCSCVGREVRSQRWKRQRNAFSMKRKGRQGQTFKLIYEFV